MGCGGDAARSAMKMEGACAQDRRGTTNTTRRGDATRSAQTNPNEENSLENEIDCPVLGRQVAVCAGDCHDPSISPQSAPFEQFGSTRNCRFQFTATPKRFNDTPSPTRRCFTSLTLAHHVEIPCKRCHQERLPVRVRAAQIYLKWRRERCLFCTRFYPPPEKIR